MNGQHDGPPTKMPVALIDVLASHQMKESVLIALLKRERTGMGSYIEVSLEASAISSLVNQATNWLMNGHNPERIGSLHPNIAPYGETFSCTNNEWLVLAIGNDRQFNQLISVLNLTEVLSIEAYSTNQSRVSHRIHMAEILASAFKTRNRNEIVQELLDSGVPVGAIKTMKEVFEGETGRNMILEEYIDGVRTLRPSSLAFRFLS